VVIHNTVYSRSNFIILLWVVCVCAENTSVKIGPTFDIWHSTFPKCNAEALQSITVRNSLYKLQSPGTGSSLIYTRRHISLSGLPQLAAERAQLKPMEQTMRTGRKGVRLSNHFSTESFISGHNCSNAPQATPYFHFRFRLITRQTCTAYANGENLHDRWRSVIHHSQKLTLETSISGHRLQSHIHPTPYFSFRFAAIGCRTCTA